jgi:hypothetical protein
VAAGYPARTAPKLACAWNAQAAWIVMLGNATCMESSLMGRGILLWLLGVPIPIILLLALLWH